MEKNTKRERKAWQLVVGAVVGLLAFCMPLLLPQSAPNGVKIVLFLMGVGILAAVLCLFASRHGGVRCPNCGTQWGGGHRGMGIAQYTREGKFRCPRCGAMMDIK